MTDFISPQPSLDLEEIEHKVGKLTLQEGDEAELKALLAELLQDDLPRLITEAASLRDRRGELEKELIDLAENMARTVRVSMGVGPARLAIAQGRAQQAVESRDMIYNSRQEERALFVQATEGIALAELQARTLEEHADALQKESGFVFRPAPGVVDARERAAKIRSAAGIEAAVEEADSSSSEEPNGEN